MLLTTKQAAQKMGVPLNYVGNLIRSGKLKTANTPKPNAQKTVWEIDPKVLREFMSTWPGLQPRRPRQSKVNGNGHAPDMLPLDIPTLVALHQKLAHIENYVIAGRIEIGDRVKGIEDKLDKLMAVWGVE